MKKKLIILLISIISLNGFSQKKNISETIDSKIETNSENNFKNIQLESKLHLLKIENERLNEKLIDLKSDFKEDLNNQKSDIKERLNIYVFFTGLILSIIGASINFFGKSAIKKRVEEIIQVTAENYAELKINEVLSTKITDEYTSKIIREKGEPEINRLLKELEEKGSKTIKEIQAKGDDVINSVWAAPPPPRKETSNQGKTDIEIKENNESIRADEFFSLAFNTKDPKIKIELYKSVLNIDDTNVSALNNIGAAQNEANKYEEAIENLTKAIELNPNFALAYSNRANSYNQLNKLDLAIENANKAIELKPKTEMAYAIKGNVLTKQKKFVEAERVLTKAIEINPKSPEAYFNRGYFNLDTKKYKDSLNDYLKAEELGFSNLAMLYNNIAVLYRKQKDYNKAIEYLEKSRSFDPDYPNIDGTLALIYSDKNDESKFYEFLKISLDKGCKVWDYLDDEGFDKYRDSGKLKKLIEPYKKNYNA